MKQNENNTAKTQRNKEYNEYVKQVTPKPKRIKNIIWAFIVGGIICVIGQGLTNFYISLRMTEDNARLFTTLSLILISAILTGLGWYSRLAKLGGAGTVVPITGFANGVVASAIEYKKEGQVFGIGSKIFTIAGPVILYGIFSSWVLGLIYWIYKLVSKS